MKIINASPFGWVMTLCNGTKFILRAECDAFCRKDTVIVSFTKLVATDSSYSVLISEAYPSIEITGPYYMDHWTETLPHDDSDQDLSGTRKFRSVRERMLEIVEPYFD